MATHTLPLCSPKSSLSTFAAFPTLAITKKAARPCSTEDADMQMLREGIVLVGQDRSWGGGGGGGGEVASQEGAGMMNGRTSTQKKWLRNGCGLSRTARHGVPADIRLRARLTTFLTSKLKALLAFMHTREVVLLECTASFLSRQAWPNCCGTAALDIVALIPIILMFRR